MLEDFIAPYGPRDIPFAQLPFNHPLFIMYSSGTTGVPKCIVHGAGGTLLQHLKEHRLHCDIRPGADKELEEARRLREEAEKVLADYRRKLGDVVTEVDNIIALAATEAKTLAAETRQSLKEHFDRRIKLAEEKIARGETEAVREFRSVAVDAAIAAAQNLIAAKLTPDRAKKLVSESIKALKSNLN